MATVESALVHQLKRSIGVPGAVAIGLAAMIGAGLFLVWSPAARIAGEWLWLALALAAAIAALNALTSAQLAMEHPVSGGAYAHGRVEVAPWVGFSAGWMFITGKTFSAAAIALTAATYISQDGAAAWAVIAIIALMIVNVLGIRVTAQVSMVIVTVVLLVVAVALGWHLTGGESTLTVASESSSVVADSDSLLAAMGIGQLPGLAVLQGAGILFFAFAGYARMATLGEEARNPRRTLPVAIVTALVIVLVLYVLVAIATTGALGESLADSVTPVADMVAHPVLRVAVIVAAVLACLGSLMGVLAGLSRTSMAMAREKDLPGVLGFVHPRTRTPIVAEVACAALAIIAVVSLPPAGLVAVSSTFVLGYYAIAHIAAIRMRPRLQAGPDGGRTPWLPAWVPVAGLVACAAVTLTLSWMALLACIAWVGLGLLFRRAFRQEA